MSKNSTPVISVVIPSYNDASYIDRLLEAITNQRFKDFEVIVSDAKSNDGTKQIIDQFKTRLAITLIESPPKGPGAGRNEGAKQARGQWLLFLDADADIDDPDFFTTLLGEAEAHGWKTTSSKMKVKDGNLVERIGTWTNYMYTKSLARTKHPVAAGWCIMTLRHTFEEHQGFNPKIHFGEDYDYVSRSSEGAFGFTDKTYYYMDLRRAREEGISFVLKGIANEVYRHTHHYNLERNPIKYEFGKHKHRE